ncbi:hypothetical protein TrRE_jg4786 [Triparma retinervis]|uniref:Glycolipid transfer protein domain-containing protein n=1 Tax=Triparma retinervis TaxID=2557542 RepID=A0A9W7DQC4_9STRA|nr:hypothetical protein TrRE_jg4786 [Triparma retinervis]
MIEKVSVDNDMLYLKTSDNKDFLFRSSKVASSTTSGSSPSIKAWHEAIQLQKSIAYSRSRASSSSDTRNRNASISGSYVTPTPTITHVIHDSNSSVLATNVSYGTTVVSSTLPDTETITILLSDGTKVPPISIPSSTKEVSKTVSHPTLGGLSFDISYERQALRKTPSLVEGLFSLPLLAFGIAHGILTASDHLEKLPVPIPSTISELYPTTLVLVVMTHLFLAPTVMRFSLCVTAKLPGWDQEEVEATPKLSEEDLKADAVMASASASDAADQRTCLYIIANEFRAALNEDTQDIDIEKLLVAASSFLELLRAQGPAMALGVKDFQGNHKKANSFYSKDKVAYSNMKALLVGEKDTGIHKPGGVNKDPSSAAGLLWMRRSIAYQLTFFQKHLNSPDESFVQAAEKAYAEELEPFHGWLLKKIFGKVVSNVPTKEDFEKNVAPNISCNRSEVVTADLKHFVEKVGPVIKVWKQIFADLDLEDVRKV